MDKNRKFREEELPLYEEWARKISGLDIVLHHADEDDILLIQKQFPDWRKNGAALSWKNSNVIEINSKLLEKCNYRSKHTKALLLHEIGHKAYPRKRSKSASTEFLAEYYAFQKASKLGLEAERSSLFWGLSDLRECCGDAKYYKHAYRMLRRVGISR